MKISLLNCNNISAKLCGSGGGGSRERALLADLAALFGQQMFYWGCDVRQSRGNLLLQLGAERLARLESHGEGSSRYRFPWDHGTVELHSYCWGWFPHEPREDGAVFIRSRGRIIQCAGGQPLTPGKYEAERLGAASPDELRRLAKPLVTWVLDYERRLGALVNSSYRERCFEAYCQQGIGNPLLPPREALEWLECFHRAPEELKRAKPRRIRSSCKFNAN